MKLSEVQGDAPLKLSDLPPDQPAVLPDMAKGAARGAITNAADLLSGASLSAQGDTAAIGAPLPRDDIGMSPEAARALIEGVTGEFSEPQTVPGKLAEKGSEFATNPLSYLGGEGFAVNAGRALAAGVGSEAAGQFADKYIGENAGGAARFVGAMTGGSVADKAVDAGRAIKGAASSAKANNIDDVAEMLMDSAGKVYQSKALNGIKYNIDKLAGAKPQIEAELRKAGMNPVRAEKTFKYLKQLEADELKAAAGGEKETAIPFTTVNDIKRSFVEDFSRDTPSEKQAALTVAGMIDKYMESASGNTAGLLKRANADYRAGATIRDLRANIEQAITTAATSGLGANVYNKLRQTANNLQKDPRFNRYLTEEERNELVKIARGGKVGDFLNHLAKLGPSHPLTGWGAAFAQDIVSGMPGVSMGQLFAGSMAQQLAPKIVLAQFAELEAKIARGAPSGSSLPQPVSAGQRAINDISARAGRSARSVAPLLTESDQ